MKFFVIFCFVLLGICGSSCDAAKDKSWRDSFAHPYNKRFSGLRIVGGQVASPHQFPYQVAMYVNRNLDVVFCGGSLISKNYVLTAAHCAEGALSIQLIFGAHNVTDNNEDAQQHQTSTSYVIHPGWDGNLLVNDLAVIKLSEPVTLNKNVQVVKLASDSNTYAGKQGTVTGWGMINDVDQVISSLLRYTSNTILSNTECKEAGSQYNAIIQDEHLCLSGAGYKGTCQGDSGGPLVSNRYQVGVTSFNYRNCEAGYPSVFGRVSQYTDWIKANSDVTF